MKGQKARRTKVPFAKKTISNYLGVIITALNMAVDDDVLSVNPGLAIDRKAICGEETPREYLTIDEVRKLIEADAPRADVKIAFLFSCFCGLRIMDIKNLCWKHISKNGNRWQVEIRQYKTGALLYLPLNMNARKWMPEQGDASSEDRVFPKLSIWYKSILRDWATDAGIEKKFSFHVARHTFATLALTAGVDIYTTSQLLGHANIRHTQRYAQIINSKKDHAISLLDDAFIQ